MIHMCALFTTRLISGIHQRTGRVSPWCRLCESSCQWVPNRVRSRHCQNAHESLRYESKGFNEFRRFVADPRSYFFSLSSVIEFCKLQTYLSKWHQSFKTFDRDSSGTIEGRELVAALQHLKYNLTPSMVMLIEQKYSMYPTASPTVSR